MRDVECATLAATSSERVSGRVGVFVVDGMDSHLSGERREAA